MRFVSDDSLKNNIFSLIIIDIDHFKSVNDGFGHRRGDEILAEFGKRVLEVSRENDLMFRYGGDEFTGIIPGADIEEALQFSSRLLNKVRGTEFIGNPPLTLTLSIGIAQFPADGLSARDLFDTADRRLYAAKRAGRNRIVVVDNLDNRVSANGVESRLLGREKELSAFQSFSEEAADKGRGFFLVLGADGAGKSCFLDGVASLLALSEYKILKISGVRADFTMPHSVLASALNCASDSDSVINALYSFTGVSMSLGVFLKDMHLIDSESIDDLLKFYKIYPGWMIVTASSEKGVLSQGSDFGGVSRSIRLGPISHEDCKAWFRAVLMWDPPNAFLEWFHNETGGLPGLFSQGIGHLERRGFLLGTSDGYQIDGDCMNFPLGNRLAFGNTAEINNLPVDLSPFLGREEELGRVKELIHKKVRLITLKGMSGMGCRRLAIRAASQNESLFPTGICFLNCENTSDSIPTSLATELSLPIGKNIKAGIESFLADTEMLLVLVNITSGDEMVRFVSRLLKTCSQITIITTSRVALEVPGEIVVPISGISTKKLSDELPSDAAGVFLQAAERLAGVRFSGDLNLNVVEDICSLVNGTPLAIELAASWIRVMSLTSIAKRIRANPSFLGGTERERTRDGLSDLFQHSWDQLSQSERNAASRLTVFAGHFTVEEAEEISDVSPEMIMSLVDRSFLLRDDQGIHIPAMTSDFILQERNQYSKGYDVSKEMHCRYFARKAASFGEMIRTGRDAGRGLSGIKFAFGDISLSWKLAIEKGRFRFLRQILHSLVVYCLDRGRLRTGYNMIQEALSNQNNEMPEGLCAVLLSYQSLLANRLGRPEASNRLIKKAINLTSNSVNYDQAVVFYIKGRLMVDQGKPSLAGSFLKQALSIFNSENRLIEALETELEILKYHLQCGNYVFVRTTLPLIAQRCKELSFRAGEWRTRLYMGNLAAADGDFRRAKDAFLGYLSSVKTAGYTDLCALALSEIASVEASMGSLGEAEQHYIAAADYFKRIGSTSGQACIKLSLAHVNQIRGNNEEVKNNYTEALELGEKANDENTIAKSLCGLAFLSIDSNDLVRSDLFFRRAVAITNRSGIKPTLIRSLYGLAVLDRIKGNLIRSAITALALLHNPSADSEAEKLCLKLIDNLRQDLGEDRMGKLEKGTEQISLQELLDMHMLTDELEKDGSYRTSL